MDRSTVTSLLVLLLSMLMGAQAAATEYYISGDGSDSNDGKSSSRAWRSITKANQTLTAGDTVLIAGGRYRESIAPARSGSSTSGRISYRASVPGTVTITGEFDLDDREYITISGINIEADRAYVRMRHSRHVTIEDSVMWGVASNPGIHMGSASFGILRRNHISGTNERYLDLIEINGDAHHNLIQDNYLDQASHALVLIEGENHFDQRDPHHNILRGNVYTNDYHHCVNVQYGSHTNVFEKESYLRCGSGDVYPMLQVTNYEAAAEGEAWHAWQPYGIYRFNVIMNSGSTGRTQDHHAAFGAMSTRQSTGRLQRVVGNHVYHNTLVDNYGIVFRLGAWCQNGDCTGVEYGDNKFKNNLLHDNPKGEAKFGDIVIRYDYYESPIFEGDEWIGNLIGGSSRPVVMWRGEEQTLDVASSEVDPQYTAFAYNRYGTPRFVDAANLNFRLSAGSDAIDVGLPLTTTVSAGAGRRIAVGDAGYFIDGFGIVEGDTVQVGTEIVRIVRVDYAQNTIEIDREISWDEDAPLSHPFAGEAPDAGAHEFALRRPAAPVLSFTIS